MDRFAAGRTDSVALAIVGGGQAARKALLSLRDADAAVDVVGVVCQPNELQDLVDDARRTTDIDTTFRRSDVDAVYIATPVHTHVPLALRALGYGKVVIIEKPLALSVRDAEALLPFRTALIAVAFKKRFGDAIRHLRAQLSSLEFRSARFDWEIPAPATPWRYAPDTAGGGVVMDLASHVLDLFEFLFGPIRRIEAVLAPSAHEVECAAEVSATFATNAIATSTVAWGSQLRQTLTIEGRAGHLVMERGTGDVDLVADSRTNEPLQFRQCSEYVRMFDELAEACRGRRSEIPTLSDGIRNLRLIEAVYEAAATRRAIAI